MNLKADMDLRALQHDIAQCEQQRCDALVKGNVAALEKLLAQDLLHIHANGQCEDRSAYLNTVAQHLEFLAVKRMGLQIRVVNASSDVAVATGELWQTIRVRATGLQIDMRIVTTQVWQLCVADGLWKQSSFHATNLA